MRKTPLFDPLLLLECDAALQGRARAVKAMIEVMGHRDVLGHPNTIVEAWQKRYHGLHEQFAMRLRRDGEFPPVGLAAFRAIADYVLVEEINLRSVCPWLPDGATAIKHPVAIETLAQLAEVFADYQKDRNGTTKVKLAAGSDAERAVIGVLDSCDVSLGGQAANIVTLWRGMGGDPRLFVAMRSQRLQKAVSKTPAIGDSWVGRFRAGQYSEELLAEMELGLFDADGSHISDAPSGGSIAVVHRGYRQLWRLTGFRDPLIGSDGEMPVNELRLYDGDERTPFAVFPAPGGMLWPHLTLFGETWIEGKTLMIRFASRSEVEAGFAGLVVAAVLGGLDSIFQDKWLVPGESEQRLWLIEAQTQARQRLCEIALAQLRGLKNVHVPVGVELSADPDENYYAFLKAACAEGLVSTVGVNGEEDDELPKLVQKRKLLDEAPIPGVLKQEATAANRNASFPHFEYLTYLRAQALAADLGVQTLYVHTTGLDFILSSGRPAGELDRLQGAAMVGKGLGLAGLLFRNYGEAWNTPENIAKLPAAVKPDAMVRLYRFVRDFVRLGKLDLENARWLIRSGQLRGHGAYSLAVLPVLWPAPSGNPPEVMLPNEFNSTGAGDMAFGAFFLLQDQDLIDWTPTRGTLQPATA